MLFEIDEDSPFGIDAIAGNGLIYVLFTPDYRILIIAYPWHDYGK